MNTLSYLKSLNRSIPGIFNDLSSITIYTAPYVNESDEDARVCDSIKCFRFVRGETMSNSLTIKAIEKSITTFSKTKSEINADANQMANMVLNQPVVATNLLSILDKVYSEHDLNLNIYILHPDTTESNICIPNSASSLLGKNKVKYTDNQQLSQRGVSFKAKDLANILQSIPEDTEVFIMTDAINGEFNKYPIIQFSYDGKSVSLLTDHFEKFND